MGGINQSIHMVGLYNYDYCFTNIIHGIEEGGLGGEGLSLSFKLLIRLGHDKPILRTY